MTIAYEICRKKTGNATYSLVQKNGQEVVSKSIQVTYRVHAFDNEDPAPIAGFGPSSVDEDMVRNAPAPTTGANFNNTLPKAGDTVYETPAGDVYYWWRCTSVGVNRNSSNGLEFSVSCTFTDTTGKEQGSAPPEGEDAEEAVGNIDPIITYASQQHEVTAWTEDETTVSPPAGGGAAPDPEPCVLPTGSLYSNPPVKVVPDQVITFSQYEVQFEPETLFERIYKLNDATWKVFSGGSSDPESFNSVSARHAMIADIAYENTSVPLLIGGVLTQTACQRVTYTIHVRDWTLKSLNNSSVIVDLNPGWDQPRVRADTRYLNTSGDPKPSSNFGTWGHQQLYLRSDTPSPRGGLPFAQGDQNGVPPYDLLKVQPQIDFDFLN
ncbi:hypothetical protein N9130_01180 [bacterium]|nr:hypothetical protein [bacterium]